MENEGTVAEAAWGSFDPSVSLEDSEVMAQLLAPQYFSSEAEQRTTMFWPSHDSDSNYDSSNVNNNYSSNYWPPQLSVAAGSSSSASASSFFNLSSSYEGYYLNDPHAMPLINEDAIVNSSLEIGLGNNFEKQMISLNEEPSSEEKAIENKRKLSSGEDDNDDTSTVFSKKKTRSSMPTSKRAKNSQSKRPQKKGINSIDEEGDGHELNAHSSSTYSSEDDSNESQEINGGHRASNSKKSASTSQNGKPRAGRGSATDPQSLYARKRRERINERLKILQKLVPNGTKVDISTMLEEAVQYVKFLQLQIKLLSSDDLWMYAPIAYNGMNIGLDLKISPPGP